MKKRYVGIGSSCKYSETNTLGIPNHINSVKINPQKAFVLRLLPNTALKQFNSIKYFSNLQLEPGKTAVVYGIYAYVIEGKN